MASGIAHGLVGATVAGATESRKMAAILQNNRLTETCILKHEAIHITRLRCSACQSQIPTVTDDQCSRLIGLITHSYV